MKAAEEAHAGRQQSCPGMMTDAGGNAYDSFSWLEPIAASSVHLLCGE